jgi:hypothetical protein
MAAQVLSIAPNNASSATFRAWGSAISAALATAGLAVTADTGQINWTTVAVPSTNATAAGYEIWKLTDALQATYPVFIKLEYGLATSNSGVVPYNCQLWVTVGTATDGAGTITASGSYPGSISGRIALFYASNVGNWYTATAFQLFVDSDGGSSLMIAGWADTAVSDAGGVLVVERSRNWDGNPSGEGVIVLAMNGGQAINSGGASFQNVPILNATTCHPTSANAWPCYALPPGGAIKTASVGTTVYAFPVFTGLTPRLNAPSKHVVVVRGGDFNANAQLSLIIYGVTHTFQAFGPFGGSGSPQDTACSCAFRIS